MRRVITCGVLGAWSAAVVSLAVVATAEASSIVYIKDEHVWLTRPDGSAPYQVTEDGGYSSPSQADDGTIVALQNPGMFVRMKQNGEQLVAPFPGMGSGENSGNFEGPYDPQVSPDGTRIAYWFLQAQQTFHPACNCWLFEMKVHTTVSRSDAFTDPSTAGYLDVSRAPSWIGNSRLLVSDYAWVSTYVPGGFNDFEQRWYNDYEIASAIAHQKLSPDLSKLVLAHGSLTDPTALLFYATNGQPWTDDGPPYDYYDDNRPRPNPPVAKCALERDSTITGVSWSPDGSAVAFGDKDGIWLATVPPTLDDCSQIAVNLIIPGGSAPEWGPAEVNPGPRPPRKGNPGPGPGPSGGCLADGSVDGLRCACSQGFVETACPGESTPSAVARPLHGACGTLERAVASGSARKAKTLFARAAGGFAKAARAAGRPRTAKSLSSPCRAALADLFAGGRALRSRVGR
jgi:hypothetical protein